MTREAWTWCGLAMLSLAWCGLAAATGGGLLVPVAAATLSTICAANAPARERVSRLVGRAFSGPTWRTALVVAGALMLIQLLPVELALLMAGDVLTYVEALAAVSLLAANNRLKPMLASACCRIGFRLAPAARRRAPPRAARATRPARRPAPSDDADGRTVVFA